MKNELHSAKICHIAKFMLIELLDVCTARLPVERQSCTSSMAVRRKAVSNAITGGISGCRFVRMAHYYTSSVTLPSDRVQIGLEQSIS